MARARTPGEVEICQVSEDESVVAPSGSAAGTQEKYAGDDKPSLKGANKSLHAENQIGAASATSGRPGVSGKGVTQTSGEKVDGVDSAKNRAVSRNNLANAAPPGCEKGNSSKLDLPSTSGFVPVINETQGVCDLKNNSFLEKSAIEGGMKKARRARWTKAQKREQQARLAQDGGNSRLEVASTAKRPLTQGDTPPEKRQIVKKSKPLTKVTKVASAGESSSGLVAGEAGSADEGHSSRKLTFADVATDGRLKVIVGSDDNTEFLVSSREADLLYDAISEAIFSVPEATFYPQFRGFGVSGKSTDGRGYFTITCNDLKSRQWLEECVKNLSAPWAGARLTVLEYGNLPKFTKGSIWIPRKIKLDSAVILQRMKKQNGHFHVDRWRLYHRNEEDPKGTLLVLGIDQQSVDVMKSRGNKLFYEIMQLTIKLKSGKDEEEYGSGNKYTEETSENTTTLEAGTKYTESVAVGIRISEAGNKYTPETSSEAKIAETQEEMDTQ